MSGNVLYALLNSLVQLSQPLLRVHWLGGEPTLAGFDFFQEVVRIQQLSPTKEWLNTIQTNATLINSHWAEFFRVHGFKVGVSIDGTEFIITIIVTTDKNRIFILTRPNGQSLVFFGTQHTNNPADEQFIRLQETWRDFVLNNTNPKIVFAESEIRDIPTTIEEAIQKRGEAGAVYWLAHQADILIECPEPTAEDQRKYLCEKFKPEEVAYAFVAQNMAGWFRQQSPQLNFNEALTHSLTREARFISLYKTTPDIEWFEKYHKDLFGDTVFNDQKFLERISDPRREDTIINKIIKDKSDFRNQSILDRIENVWHMGKNIFILYGIGHLVSLEAKLREKLT